MKRSAMAIRIVHPLRWRSAIVLGPLTFLLLVFSTAAHASPGTWTATGSLTNGRYDHTATLLPSGKVLSTGGYAGSRGVIATAELYDPATGVWSPTGSLSNGRFQHTATLLPSGKVLVAGGYGIAGTLSSAELYDPATGVWTPTGSLSVGRYIYTATLLPSGKVLAAAGYGTAGTLSSAELYDPATGVWMPTGSLGNARALHTASLLPSGKVLAAGGSSVPGDLSSAELYDPSTGVWTPTGRLTTARYRHTATLLASGKVLAAAGYNDAIGADLSTAELYDPATGVWSATGSLNIGRGLHTATLLPSGKVLAAAGSRYNNVYVSSAELYDPATGVWAPTGSLNVVRTLHSATLLQNGRVLVAAGNTIIDGSYYFLYSAELYDPSIPSAPTIISANSTTFTVGTAGSFPVTAIGNPAPTLSLSGTLPAGVTFTAASGLLSGTPVTGSANTYNLVFTASNGVPPDATQNFTLTVNPVPPAVLTSPIPGATLTAASQLFSWSSVASADTYSLWVGSTVGGYEYYNTYCLCTSTTVTGLPTNGSSVDVRLWTHTADGWNFNDYSFTAVGYAVISSPAPGSTLSGASVPFTWTSAAAADYYALWVGSSVDGYDYYYVYCACNSTMVTGLPTNSSTVYVRMWTHTTVDDWTFTDYTYIAAAAP